MNATSIRNSRKEDLRQIYALTCDMENKVLCRDAFEAIYNRQLEDGHFLCLVCEEGGQVIGFINLRIEEQLHHAARICEIMEIAVDARYRSNGIGQQLFDEACRQARNRQCTQIEVCCNQLRQRTHRFYAARGMHNFHYKFSLNFEDPGNGQNQLGR